MAHPLTPFPWSDLIIIVALVALNGVFAMSELAIVSARRARLEAMAGRGPDRGENHRGASRCRHPTLTHIPVGLFI